jgi:YD repeat-containing protein
MKYLLLPFCIFYVHYVDAQKTITFITSTKKNQFSQKLVKRVASKELYNAQNQLIESFSYDDDTTDYEHTIFEYDKDNRLIMQSKIKSNANAISTKTAFLYDDQLISSIEYKSNDTVVKNYTYNEKGQLQTIKYKINGKKDPLHITETYSYDGFNQLIKITKTSNNSSFLIKEYIYSEKDGSKIEEHYNWNGKRKQNVKTLKYNNKGLLIEENNEFGYNYYTYTYNEQGEWITKQYCHKNLKIHSWTCNTVYREIRVE